MIDCKRVSSFDVCASAWVGGRMMDDLFKLLEDPRLVC